MRNRIVSTEWYTPLQYMQAARTVLKKIDLDPASSAVANETVQAERFYTKDDNGLALPWYGKIWLNPPFGRVNGGGKSVIGMFVTKLVNEYRAGNVEEAIALLPVQTNASWYWPLFDYPRCVSLKRVHFNKLTESGLLLKDSRDSHMLGTVFVYLGTHEQEFVQAFKQFGPIDKRIDVSIEAQIPKARELWSA